jgi:NAD+ synthase
MVTLYGVAAMENGRVCNTCNLSEDFTGWSTKFGDAAGDFSLLGNLTKTEVCKLGHTFEKIPSDLVDKTPSDGMCGSSDEDKMGFTYEVLDTYIRTGLKPKSKEVLEKIEKMHNNPNTQKKIVIAKEDTFSF